MQAELKKFVLVYPPLTTPTSPPLGMAMLKGFIERELPSWQVKILDLNCWCISRMLKGLAQGEFKLDPKIFPKIEEETSLLLEGARIFSGQQQTGFHDRPDLYDHFADPFFALMDPGVSMLAQKAGSWQLVRPSEHLVGEMLQIILNEAPDSVGVSMLFSHQLQIGVMLGRSIRSQAGLKVFFGGSLFAKKSDHLLKLYPDAADVIVEGDGEEPLLQLLANGGKPDGIPGTTFLRNGETVKSDPVYKKNIDFYGAPDFSDLDLESYYSPETVVPLLLSRGCYWRRCAFCVHHQSAGLTYRTHSIEMVIKMLQKFVGMGIQNFSFVDEMISPSYFSRLSQAIIESGMQISYYALAKPERGFTPNLLADMAQSGCKNLIWGVESGCQRVLDLIDKGTKVQNISMVLKNAHESGIANHVFIICGFPTETLSEFTQTIKVLDDNKNHIHAILRGVFTMDNGSKIFNNPKQFNINNTWLNRPTPFGGHWGYSCSSGMSMDEAQQTFQSTLPFFRAFSPYGTYLPVFRDHALLFYKHLGNRILPKSRKFPTMRYY